MYVYYSGPTEAAVRGCVCHGHVWKGQDQREPSPLLPQRKVLRKIGIVVLPVKYIRAKSYRPPIIKKNKFSYHSESSYNILFYEI